MSLQFTATHLLIIGLAAGMLTAQEPENRQSLDQPDAQQEHSPELTPMNASPVLSAVLAHASNPSQSAAFSVNVEKQGGPLENPIIQPMLAATPWDWTSSVGGLIPLNQYQFCDSMPASRTADIPYSPSGSFTNNYSTFLDLIDDSGSPLKSQIDAARSAVKTPPGSPVDSGNPPDGWAKVTDEAGQLQWRMIWSVSSMPSDWTASVSGDLGATFSFVGNQNPSIKESLQVGPYRLQAKLSDGENLALSDQELESFSIDFEAAGWVAIYPGAWFDSGLVSLAQHRKLKFLPGYDHANFFGRRGLIAQRKGGFFVGSNPTISWTSRDPVNEKIESATSVSGGGITLQKKTANFVKIESQNGVTRYSVKPKYTSLFIIAVEVQRL